MAKDYKDRIPAYRRRKRRGGLAWAWMGGAVAGLVGLVAVGIHFFSGSAPTETQNGGTPSDTLALPIPSPHGVKPGETGKPTAPNPNGKPPQPPEASPSQEPRFSFYKILPEKEVIIPENEIKTLKREESLGQKPQAVYTVQAGSFTKQQDAERLKAQLAQLKVKAKLEMIKLENTAWYRVKLGPYASLADADKVRQYLRGSGIDSIVQKAAAQ